VLYNQVTTTTAGNKIHKSADLGDTVPLFSQLGMYWRFARDLRKFLKDPITLEQSRQIVRQRLLDREEYLLAIVKRTVYDNKRSPYLELLRLAGCEYGDFEGMARSVGIEDTLKKLCEKGVYVTIEEFKCKKEIKRGSKSFQVKERDFDNPCLSHHFEVRSGGSRSAGTRTLYDYEFLAANRAVSLRLLLDAYNAFDIPHAFCFHIMPGGGPSRMLVQAKVGKIPVKWFSQVDTRNFKPSLKNRLGNDYIIYMGRIFGAKFPRPEFVSMDNTHQIAKWMADTIKRQGGCYMATFTSTAVRICHASRQNGLDISGAKFSVTGEPITEAKRKEIEAVGASVCPHFVFTEAGYVGIGCFSPFEADDVHFLKDSFALIQHRRQVPHAGASVDAFLFTSLLLSGPKVLLNVESGDYGVVETRSCGCKFEELGLTEHIHHIRGFDKLTSAGMTFIGTDLLRIMDHVLPARFGGSSTDYQIVEEEDSKGHTSMNILVSPDVGSIDEKELIHTVLAELGRGQDSNRLMAEVWAESNTLRVKRIRPLATARGKILPLHIQKLGREGSI